MQWLQSRTEDARDSKKNGVCNHNTVEKNKVYMGYKGEKSMPTFQIDTEHAEPAE
jgi:hypothetical protein